MPLILSIYYTLDRIPSMSLCRLTMKVLGIVVTLACSRVLLWSPCANRFLDLINSLGTLLKQFVSHQARSQPHFSTLVKIASFESLLSMDFHIASTISPHQLSKSHISSNLKGFFSGGGSRPERLSRIGTWSEVSHQRWLIRKPGKSRKKKELLLANPRSNLSKVTIPKVFTPSEPLTREPQIHKATFINHISKELHLVMRALSPS